MDTIYDRYIPITYIIKQLSEANTKQFEQYPFIYVPQITEIIERHYLSDIVKYEHFFVQIIKINGFTDFSVASDLALKDGQSVILQSQILATHVVADLLAEISQGMHNDFATNVPSFSPTASPSHSPSLSPSNSPSGAPTRVPTQDMDTIYDRYIPITYIIKQLSEANTKQFEQYPFIYVPQITEIIERHYLSDIVKYEHFFVQIIKINGFTDFSVASDLALKDGQSVILQSQILATHVVADLLAEISQGMHNDF
eukprot:286955_1